jgi:hypothetical protein
LVLQAKPTAVRPAASVISCNSSTIVSFFQYRRAQTGESRPAIRTTNSMLVTLLIFSKSVVL